MIDTNKLTALDSGCYGTYYPLNSSRGLKVLTYSPDEIKEEFELQQKVYRLLKKKKLRVEGKIVSVPKPIGLVPVINDIGKRTHGLKMQHVEGRHPKSFWDFSERERNLKRLLSTIGIRHRDLHSFNVIITKSRFYLLDWDPKHSNYLPR